jgi:hypothetical protein
MKRVLSWATVADDGGTYRNKGKSDDGESAGKGEKTEPEGKGKSSKSDDDFGGGGKPSGKSFALEAQLPTGGCACSTPVFARVAPELLRPPAARPPIFASWGEASDDDVHYRRAMQPAAGGDGRAPPAGAVPACNHAGSRQDSDAGAHKQSEPSGKGKIKGWDEDNYGGGGKGKSSKGWDDDNYGGGGKGSSAAPIIAGLDQDERVKRLLAWASARDPRPPDPRPPTTSQSMVQSWFDPQYWEMQYKKAEEAEEKKTTTG